MERTRRILERLPAFYQSLNEGSMIFLLIQAFGMRLQEAQSDMIRVLRSHWIDTAHGGDLDRLGALYILKRQLGESDDEYRRRIKASIQEYRGGGTLTAIMGITQMLLDVEDGVEILENPPSKRSWEEKGVRSGYILKRLRSDSIVDSIPSITITVDYPREALFGKAMFDRTPLPPNVTDLVIVNSATQESIGFKGVVEAGQKLVLEQGRASLDGIDASERLTSVAVPTLLRGGSDWRFTEKLGTLIGIFDSARFDEGTFEVGVASVRIRFEWTAPGPAAFELRVPAKALKRAGLSIQDLSKLIARVKAVGVKVNVRAI